MDDQEGTLDNGDKVFWHGRYKNYVDTGGVVSVKTRVPDIENYEAVQSDRWPMGTPGEYTQYNGGNGKYDPTNPQEGWYFKEIERNQDYDMRPLNAGGHLRCYKISISYRDRFRYISDNIDKKLVDFPEYRMTYDFNFNEERTTTPEGYPARVVKHDCKAKYLGKDFYWAVIDTIYQTTPLKAPPKSIRKISSKSSPTISSKSSQKIPSKNTRQQTKPLITTKKRK